MIDIILDKEGKNVINNDENREKNLLPKSSSVFMFMFVKLSKIDTSHQRLTVVSQSLTLKRSRILLILQNEFQSPTQEQISCFQLSSS